MIHRISRCAFMVAVVLLAAVVASDAPGKTPTPNKKAIKVAKKTAAQKQPSKTDIAAIARQVLQIEGQAATYSKMEFNWIDCETLTCCTCGDGHWTAYLQNGQLRKAVVPTGEGDLVELYFDHGKLIFVVETFPKSVEGDPYVIGYQERYYLKDGRLIFVTTSARGQEGRGYLHSQKQLREAETRILEAVAGRR